jgi:hypothetical protein
MSGGKKGEGIKGGRVGYFHGVDISPDSEH